MRNRQVNVATPITEPEAQPINRENRSEWLQTRPGERCLIRISAADTNGAYSVVEIVSDSRDGTPVHVHQNEDEHFIIHLSEKLVARATVDSELVPSYLDLIFVRSRADR